MPLRRDWSIARAAHMGRPCRVCGRGAYGQDATLELGHVIGRAFDAIERGSRGGRVAVVHPCSVVVLCREHHRKFDAHELDLWLKLTAEERVWAINRVGEGEARRRISGRGFLEAA